MSIKSNLLLWTFKSFLSEKQVMPDYFFVKSQQDFRNQYYLCNTIETNDHRA